MIPFILILTSKYSIICFYSKGGQWKILNYLIVFRYVKMALDSKVLGEKCRKWVGRIFKKNK